DSRESQNQLTSVLPLYNELHKSGLSAIGVSMDPNPKHISMALDDITVPWPQVPDRSGLAARYKIDSNAGLTFVLDASHRILAYGKMGPDMDGIIRKLFDNSRARSMVEVHN
ncbi:MAG TPA: hypothetical protein VKZ53_00285, partial [Candidatus Angelobacter sp.]|nr:hypothetical protein [Candidatus Angelobacter sp.]